MNQVDVIDAFKPDFSRKHGCAWFMWEGDSGVRQPEKTGGWASIGGEPAFQFHRPQDLPKDVIWWTNLSKPEAWSLGRWSHIKHAGFLGPHWLALMSEWGFPTELEQLKASCAAWSEVLARLGNWLTRWSAAMTETASGNEPHPSWSWGDGEFHEALADKLGWNMPRNESHPVLEVAFCDHVETELPASVFANKRKITMTLPRAAHARRILATRYPVGEFKEIPLAEWSTDSQRRWEWLAKQTLPVLVRFDDLLWRPGFEEQAALWWGLRGRRFAGAAMESVWLTGEEALEMQPYTDTVPSVALRAQGWTRLNDVPHWPDFNMGILYENSIVTGLLHEGLWRAAATPARTPTKRIKSGVSARAVWWRSADRRACFEAALQFQTKGFTVVSYGEGGVTVLFDPKTVLMADWVDAIDGSGVRVPKMLADQLRSPSQLSAQSIDVWLKSSQDIGAWLLLDRLLWPWVGHQKQVLKNVLESALRALAAIPPPAEGGKQWSREWKDELMKCSRQAVKEAVKNSPGYAQGQ